MKVAIRILMCLCIGFSSCQRTLDKLSYVKYIQSDKSGLFKKVPDSDVEYLIQCKPIEYVLINEHLESKEELETRRKELSGTIWFNVKIKSLKSEQSPLYLRSKSQSEYDYLNDYFLNKAVSQIELIYNGTLTLKPIAYQFENNYNLTPDVTMVVGFKLPNADLNSVEKLQVIYYDKVFNNTIIKASISKQALKDIPPVNII